MKQSGRPRRAPSNLPDSIHRQLNMYALAATAAGVGALALAQPAEAKIVYHKAHVVINNPGHYSLDLNGDHQPDFKFSNTSNGHAPAMFVLPQKNNRVWGNGSVASGGSASVLSSGASIGPNSQHFKGKNDLLFRTHTFSSSHSGKWINITNGYLGLKFYIQGKIHYGWARLTTHGTE